MTWATARRRAATVVLVAPAVALMAGFFVWPLVEAVFLTTRGHQVSAGLLWSNPYRRDLVFTLISSLVAALVAVGMGFGLVALLTDAAKVVRSLVTALAMTPLLVPHLIAAYAIRLALAPRGPLLRPLFGDQAPNLLVGPVALVVALVWKLLPYAYLSAIAARSSVPNDLIEAARDVGAGAWRRGRVILLPLMAPGLMAGGVLIFVLAAAQYSITLIVYAGKHTTTIPMDVFFLQQANETGQGAAIGLAFAALVVALSLLGGRLSRRVARRA